MIYIRKRTRRYLANVPIYFILFMLLFFAESAGAQFSTPPSKEQMKELQQFIDTASEQEIFERIDVDSVDFTRGENANLYQEEFLLKELIRRDTHEARQYIEKIYTPYMNAPSLDNGPWQPNRIVCEAIISRAELEAGTDEGERLKRYDVLMERRLEWGKSSLDRLQTMIAYRLIGTSSRESLDFLKKYEWHDRYEFREILLDRIAAGLTRAEQKAYIRQAVFDNYERFSGGKGQSEFTPFLAELHHLTGLADQSLYQLILLIDEYETTHSSLESDSAPLHAYSHLLKNAIEISRRQVEFKNFSAIEPLYRANDPEGLRRVAESSENQYAKVDIYELFLRLKMKEQNLNQSDEVEFLLEDEVLRGVTFESIVQGDESSPYSPTKALRERTSTVLLLDYGPFGSQAVQRALESSSLAEAGNTDRIALLKNLILGINKMTQVRGDLEEWRVLPKVISMEHENRIGQSTVEG